MRELLYILLFLLFSPSIVFSQQENNLTLSQCIEIGVRNNPDIQKARLQSEAGKILLQQSKTNLLPSLNAGYVTGANHGRSIDPFTNSYINQQYNYASPSASGSMTIFNGFLLLNTIRKNVFSFEADKLAIQQAEDQLTLNIMRAYLTVLSCKELLAIASTQKESTKKQMERLSVLHEQQAVAPGTYYDLKGTLANDELSVINASNNLENAKLALSQLLNVPYNKHIELSILQTEIDGFNTILAEDLYNAALDQLAAVKTADMRKRAADIDVKIKRSSLYPSVFLYGSMNSNYSGAADVKYRQQINNNLNTSVYAGLNVPLFNSFKTRNAVRLSKIEQRDAALNANTARIQLRQLTDEAYFTTQFARDKYIIGTQQVNDFSESFKREEIRFNLGAGTIVDYIVTKNNYDRSRIALTNARYEYIFRTKILDFLQGKKIE